MVVSSACWKWHCQARRVMHRKASGKVFLCFWTEHQRAPTDHQSPGTVPSSTTTTEIFTCFTDPGLWINLIDPVTGWECRTVSLESHLFRSWVNTAVYCLKLIGGLPFSSGKCVLETASRFRRTWIERKRSAKQRVCFPKWLFLKKKKETSFSWFLKAIDAFSVTHLNVGCRDIHKRWVFCIGAWG